MGLFEIARHGNQIALCRTLGHAGALGFHHQQGGVEMRLDLCKELRLEILEAVEAELRHQPGHRRVAHPGLAGKAGRRSEAGKRIVGQQHLDDPGFRRRQRQSRFRQHVAKPQTNDRAPS